MTHVFRAGAVALLVCTALSAAGAQIGRKYIEGRTGLPAVRSGGGNIRMERGVVQMRVAVDALVTTQTFRLHYPGPPLETGPQPVTIAVREDYYRSTEHGAPPVTRREAKGFRTFEVVVDGRRVASYTGPWHINDKEDTATRWRSWNLMFLPDQVHRMQILSEAPLGRDYNRKYVEFVSKDLSDFRGAPEYLEIRFSAPGRAESRLAALAPKPNEVNPHAVQWVFRKARPRRDVYLQMPVGYGRYATR